MGSLFLSPHTAPLLLDEASVWLGQDHGKELDNTAMADSVQSLTPYCFSIVYELLIVWYTVENIPYIIRRRKWSPQQSNVTMRKKDLKLLIASSHYCFEAELIT